MPRSTYLLLVQFHEDFCLRLCLYCLVPTCMMWYFPELSPILVLTATRCINEVMQGKHQTTRNKFRMFLSCLLYAACSALSHFVDFRGMTEVFESIFGPAEIWPVALLPILPGMYLRSVEERPCSVNGFVPEGKQGICILCSQQ